jgi:hypothetical protein
LDLNRGEIGVLFLTGVFFFCLGQQFEGHFKRGVRDGNGVLYRNDGSSLRCVWREDAPSPPVVLTQSSGAT